MLRSCLAIGGVIPLIVLLAAIALGVRDLAPGRSVGDSLTAWKDLLLYVQARSEHEGVQFHVARAGGWAAVHAGGGTAQHAGRTVHLGFESVARKLEALPAELAAGTARHPHSHGVVELARAPWNNLSATNTSSLALPPPQQAAVRAFLSERFGAASSPRWTAQAMRLDASEFLSAGSGFRLHVKSSACIFAQQWLWRVGLDIELSRSDANEWCENYLQPLVLHALMPGFASRLWRLSVARQVQRKRMRQMRNCSVIVAAAGATLGDEANRTAEQWRQLELLSLGMHDALALMGGAAVPDLIVKTIWALKNGTAAPPLGLAPPLLADDERIGPADTEEELDAAEDLLRLCVLEMLRMFPEVSHVPIDRDGGDGGDSEGASFELLSLEAAMRDPQKWGDTANAFDVGRASSDELARELARLYAPYEPYAMSWGAGGLSLAITEAFVGAFVASADQWVTRDGAPYELGATLFRAGTVYASQAQMDKYGI